MREPYGKAVAPRTGPAPWWCVRKGVLQALAGERGGRPLSREIIMNPKQVEGRGPAKDNSLRGSEDRTQCREPLQAALERIRQARQRLRVMTQGRSPVR